MPIAIWYDMREGLDRLEERTKQFGIDVIALSMKLERMPGLSDMASQLRRAAGSVAANHRAMRRARSMKEFAAKLQIVNEESDECVLWLEMADQLCEPQTTRNLTSHAFTHSPIPPLPHSPIDWPIHPLPHCLIQSPSDIVTSRACPVPAQAARLW